MTDIPISLIRENFFTFRPVTTSGQFEVRTWEKPDHSMGIVVHELGTNWFHFYMIGKNHLEFEYVIRKTEFEIIIIDGDYDLFYKYVLARKGEDTDNWVITHPAKTGVSIELTTDEAITLTNMIVSSIYRNASDSILLDRSLWYTSTVLYSRARQRWHFDGLPITRITPTY